MNKRLLFKCPSCGGPQERNVGVCRKCYLSNKKSEADKNREGQKEKKRAFCRRYHNEHKEEINSRHRDYSANRKKEFLEFKMTFACEWCGEGHPACLDFHHKDRAEKDNCIANMKTCSPEAVRGELEKCMVLCANCHRKLHWEEKHDPI